MVGNPYGAQGRTTFPDALVAELSGAQNGLVTASQLQAAGLTKRMVQRRLDQARLHRVHRGVYAVGHAVLTPEARMHAAVLAVGPDAGLSHVSAAVLWGLLRGDLLASNRPVDVSTTRNIAGRRGIRLHRSRSLQRAHITRQKGIPVTTPARTLIDLAGGVPDNWLTRALHEAEVKRLIDPNDLKVPANARGAERLRAALARGPAPTRSPFEDRMLDLLLDNGFPRPRVNARVRAGGKTYEVDFLFPQHRLIVETDGERYHGTRWARERDQDRQAALEAAGYAVLRISWRQVDEAGQRPQTLARVRRALRAAARA